MADITHEVGTPTVWADTTDYSSTGSGLTRTHQIDLTSVAAGAARQGAKADLGANRARQYATHVGIEFGTAPTAGANVEIYWAASHSATAATGNQGGASGSDAAYKAAEESEWKRQLTFIGALILTNDGSGTVQRGVAGIFTPPNRYGMPVVVNNGGQTLQSDAVEMYVALVPIVDDAA